MDFQNKIAIFDVDGTLLDSMGLWRNGFIEYANERLDGKVNADFFENQAMKMTLKDGIKYYKSIVDDETPNHEIVRIIKAYVHRGYLDGQRVKEGVLRLLKYLRDNNVKMYVFSATPRHMVTDGLKVAGLYDYFESVFSVEGRQNGKDSPDTFFEVLNEIGVAPCDAIIFEDALYSIRSARKAGLYTVGVGDDYNKHEIPHLIETADEFAYTLDEFCDRHKID